MMENVNRKITTSGSHEKHPPFVITLDGENMLLRLVDEYIPTGNYMHSDKIQVEKRNVTFDESGIPKVNFRWGTHYYPITIAQYGLQHHALYLLTNDRNSYEKFIMVADYFTKTQDRNGGWPTEFNHTFYKGRTKELKAPWYSAMAQGQAMSLLVRAYDQTKKTNYLDSAKKGLKLFSRPVKAGGLLRKFEGKFWFYEEYPTEPASYVLNGFIYSLVGLYDVAAVSGSRKAKKLYDRGIQTLRRMISLYDLGNRTAYDLTHLTTEGNAPNVARWGYHSTHLLVLSVICAIENDPIFQSVLERWIGYAKGITAKTN